MTTTDDLTEPDEAAGAPTFLVRAFSTEKLLKLRERITDVLDEREALAMDEEVTDPHDWLPIILGGGRTFRCHRCQRPLVPRTYHVAARNTAGVPCLETCRYCAMNDEDLRHYQGFADLADAVDAFLESIPDQDSRTMFGFLIVQAADHFAVWRTPNGQT